ncbi:uncharacterized protein LOC120272744 [Dioscorea cayenensis subsp. rotundata]|uniref:Uncharacterized protein LOC120272744 n=1 Tax=Dioscorea cayennensis subsp. rotundata TaxID=55577 RepID=A0AB40C6T2_DIOCR|nr:uncharacterized protein LOC120272744 [Dioscorea cayenensis subsp. rotundata]
MQPLSESTSSSLCPQLSSSSQGGCTIVSNARRANDSEITTIGHRYEDARHFKDALSDFAIRCNFNYRFIKNDKERVTVVCAAEGCQWHIHASQEGNLATFRIKTSHDVHSCGGGISSASHPKASKKWVSRKVIQKLRDHGVRLPYKQAWRGKELARGILHGCDKASYDLLLWYASKVTETNPDSIVLIEKDGERFRLGFFCFQASLDGFRMGCRPMLFLDGTHLLGRYGGILLGATGKDGNEGFFQLAFAIVDNETDDNWTWFILKLGDALYGDDEYHDIITFISDRSKGLVNGVSKVFPSATHGYCLCHLQANFLKSNSQLGKILKDECWRLIANVAYACTSTEFDAATNELQQMSSEAHSSLLHKLDVSHWSNYLFIGRRWGEMYSNVAEWFNSWIREARHLPICNIVDSIRFKMMNMMCDRREHCQTWDTYLYPTIHKKIEDVVEESRALVIGRSDGEHFEVIDNQMCTASLKDTTLSTYFRRLMPIRFSLFQIMINHGMTTACSNFGHPLPRKGQAGRDVEGLSHKHLAYENYDAADGNKLAIIGLLVTRLSQTEFWAFMYFA